MLLVYASRTNNIVRFVARLSQITNVLRIETNAVQRVAEPFWLITYTDKLGEVPEPVWNFLDVNNRYLRGVAASGNRNFGKNFANAADVIARKYKVPVIMKFELSGTQGEAVEFETRFLAAAKTTT